ncbi:MAG: DUF2147 domain-containing protein [Pseudomonadota bacterium]
MKTTILTAALLAAGTLAAADPVEGVWQTQPGDAGNFAHVEIAACGTAICGTILRAYGADGAARTSDTVGKQMIWDMAANGDGTYAGGRIWAPDRDKTYRSKMELAGDRLKVSGCVGPICRGQTWARVN